MFGKSLGHKFLSCQLWWISD